MSAAHTPGPWELGGELNAAGDELRMVKTTDWRRVSVAYCPCLADDSAERDANARLIAAAPDLLVALKACEDLLAEFEGGGATNPELLLARTAIARAEGKD